MRIPVAIAVAVLVALVGGGCGNNPAPVEERDLRVTVSGMHCEGCAEGITRRLLRQKGVLAADVHFSNAVQTVRYDARRVEAADLVAVIARAGFTVETSGSP